MKVITDHISRLHRIYDPDCLTYQILPMTLLGESDNSQESLVLINNFAGFKESIFDNPHAKIRVIDQYKLVTFPVTASDPVVVEYQIHKLKLALSRTNASDFILSSRTFSKESIDVLSLHLDDSVTLVDPKSQDLGITVPRNSLFYNFKD